MAVMPYNCMHTMDLIVSRTLEYTTITVLGFDTRFFQKGQRLICNYPFYCVRVNYPDNSVGQIHLTQTRFIFGFSCL